MGWIVLTVLDISDIDQTKIDVKKSYLLKVQLINLGLCKILGFFQVVF